MDATDLTIPKAVYRLGSMPDVARAALAVAVQEHAISADAGIIFYDGLKALDDDSSVVVAALCVAMYSKGLFREGFAQAALLSMRRTEAVVTPSSAPVPPKKKRKSARGLLPFRRLPKATEDRATFVMQWARESGLSGGKYPLDMLEWKTGTINWDASEVYTYVKGTMEWFIYAALIVGPRTYDELLDLEFRNASLRAIQDDVDYALKRIMVEPSWLPPGAGEYGDNPDTGKMWITRDDQHALYESLPWRRSA